MSMLGARTKKVTTYGKKKSQVITVHSDFSPSFDLLKPDATPPIRPNLPISSGSTSKRPPLQSKTSNDLPTAVSLKLALSSTSDTVKPKSKIGAKQSKDGEAPTKGSIAGVKINVHKVYTDRPDSPSSTDSEPIIRPKRVARPGRIVVPRSPGFDTPKRSPVRDLTTRSKIPVSPLATRPPATPRSLVHVVIPVSRPRQALQRPTTTVHEDSDDLAEDLSRVSIDSSESDFDRLLHLTGTSSPLAFDSFFSSAPLLRLMPGCKHPQVRKLGEASYSEVFGLNVGEFEAVAKIVPLLGPESIAIGKEKRVPDCSEVVDVVREVQITRRMSEMTGGGFVNFLGAFVVEGKYPEDLLDLWDDYKSESGSASARPVGIGADVFTAKQKYAVIVLANGGTDLETFEFDAGSGWVQAAGVFWQTACALARAESWARFEHRDLHEGQVLIRPTADGPSAITESPEYTSPFSCGVDTTIIDFGLSRLDLEDGESTGVSLPPEVYEGVGEQWDVYRAMRYRVRDWTLFNPITNVLWLQYILRRLLRSTPSLVRPKLASNGLRPGRKPTTQKGMDKAALRDRAVAAYEVLLIVEEKLGEVVATRKRGEGGVEGSAKGVVAWGKENGWVV